MPARAHVESWFAGDGVRIGIKTGEPGAYIMRTWKPGSGVIVSGRSGALPEVPSDETEWLVLDTEEARAVYQALGEYFGTQVSDNRLLRADYEHERRRMDKIIDAVIEANKGS